MTKTTISIPPLCPVVRGMSRDHFEDKFWEIRAPKLVSEHLDWVALEVATKMEERISDTFKDRTWWAWFDIHDHDIQGSYPHYGDIKVTKGTITGTLRLYATNDKQSQTWEAYKENVTVHHSFDGKFTWSDWNVIEEFKRLIRKELKYA